MKILISESSFNRLFEKIGGLFSDEYSDEDNKKWSENNKKKEEKEKKKTEQKKKRAENKIKRDLKKKENEKKYDQALDIAFGYKKDLFSDDAPSKEERDKAKDFLKKNKK